MTGAQVRQNSRPSLPVTSPLLSVFRSRSPWHYSKNGKPALSPRHDWLNTGSLRQNVPLRIWFYPQ
ncbi:serine/threonine protein kinase [Escherichia coli]|uniref:serine/threonine protein kinase n=1 Tax=Escherichia coli TaxID=562 RepID=UPI00358EBFDB